MSEIIADLANFSDLVGFWCWLLVSKFAPYKVVSVIFVKYIANALVAYT